MQYLPRVRTPSAGGELAEWSNDILPTLALPTLALLARGWVHDSQRHIEQDVWLGTLSGMSGECSARPTSSSSNTETMEVACC